jgi:hypothetical protein
MVWKDAKELVFENFNGTRLKGLRKITENVISVTGLWTGIRSQHLENKKSVTHLIAAFGMVKFLQICLYFL